VSSRYSICANAEQLANRYSVDVSSAFRPHSVRPLPSSFRSSPIQALKASPSFTGDWRRVGWNKPISEKVIHVPSEVIPKKAVYRKMLAERRCLIPADGSMNGKKWGKKTAIPYRYTLQNKELFSMAGLWEEYEDEQGEQFHTFSLITCAANDLVALAHDRMPVIFAKEKEQIWLSPSLSAPELLSLLKPYDANRMDAYTVSPRINLPNANDSVVDIAGTTGGSNFGNLTLFD